MIRAVVAARESSEIRKYSLADWGVVVPYGVVVDDGRVLAVGVLVTGLDVLGALAAALVDGEELRHAPRAPMSANAATT